MFTTISASELHEDPSARFWALILYLSEHPDAMTADPDLHTLHSAFGYDADVLNGGHLQYFQNRGVSSAPAAISALQEIGATQHASILREALSKILASPIAPATSLEEYAELAKSGPFSEQDARYHKLQHSVVDMLEEFISPKLPTLVGVRSDA